MEPPELWLLSLQAFTAVLAVLGLLAAVVYGLGVVLPHTPSSAAGAAADASAGTAEVARPGGNAAPSSTDDAFARAAAIAAVRATAQRFAPGSDVLHVEEVRGSAVGGGGSTRSGGGA